MKELSLNILDIAKNSVTAGAKHIGILLHEEADGWLTLTIQDDGKGMDEETLRQVTDPFYTTRTTRKVGMGIPLLTLAAEQTGGTVTIRSRPKETHPDDHGTEVLATFQTRHLDFTPLGNVTDSLCVLIQGNPEIDFTFIHTAPTFSVAFSTEEIRQILGNEVSLAEYEVIAWIRGYIEQQYE